LSSLTQNCELYVTGIGFGTYRLKVENRNDVELWAQALKEVFQLVARQAKSAAQQEAEAKAEEVYRQERAQSGVPHERGRAGSLLSKLKLPSARRDRATQLPGNSRKERLKRLSATAAMLAQVNPMVKASARGRAGGEEGVGGGLSTLVEL
jgi:hypothetical protein